jgi:hypothetical protein
MNIVSIISKPIPFWAVFLALIVYLIGALVAVHITDERALDDGYREGWNAARNDQYAHLVELSEDMLPTIMPEESGEFGSVMAGNIASRYDPPEDNETVIFIPPVETEDERYRHILLAARMERLLPNGTRNK